MSKSVSIKKNLAFQTVYQIVNTCLPLITSPYLSRVLGASQLGVFSFTSSTVSYFMLFAMLGTYNHGTRSIAACGSDKEKISTVFWGIFKLHATVNVLCIVAYVVFLCFFCKENQIVSTIFSIELLSCFFNIAWLYAGLEKIQFMSVRGLIIRVLSVICILLFVNKPEDLWIYALITALSAIINQLVLWLYLGKHIQWVNVSWRYALSNFKPILLLFIPLLAMSVYHIMDKTMLGIISNYEQSGYYYNADKIVNIMVSVISGVSTVMLPRMSSLISSGKTEESNRLFRISLEGTVIAGSAIAFGIAAIANEFEPLFFGPGYEECIILTIVLAPVLIIKSYSITARYQFLIPNHKEKYYISSVIIGAVVNLIANIICIPLLGAMGAVIGTLIAELTSCIVQYVAIQKMISIRSTLIRSLVYLAFGILMFVSVRMVSVFSINIVLKIATEIAAGAAVYISLCEIYWKKTNNKIQEVMFGDILKKRIKNH